MEILIEDIKYALSMLRNSRGFLRSAVVTLALGIGANIAAFAVVNSVLLRPAPFREPDRLVRIFDDLAGPADLHIYPARNAIIRILDKLHHRPGAICN